MSEYDFTTNIQEDMGPQIQGHCHINDFIPTEDTRKWKKILDKHQPPVNYTMKQLRKSIKRHGIKDQIRIKADGKILNGNARYWIAREYYEAGDMRFEYLPVEIEHFAGIIMIDLGTEKPKDMKEIKDTFLLHVNKKIPVIPVGQLRDAEFLAERCRKQGKQDINQQGQWEVVIYKSQTGRVKEITFNCAKLDKW